MGRDGHQHPQRTPPIQTLIHELGHVYGNYDEYRGSGFMGWVERRMYWHDNDHLSDTSALMNDGSDFRARYFDHIQQLRQPALRQSRRLVRHPGLGSV